MMRKQKQAGLTIVCVLMLIAFATVNSRGETTLGGQIFWKKEMGLIPTGSGSTQASARACSAFFIYVTNSADNKIFGRSTGPYTDQPREKDGYYICDYRFKVSDNPTRTHLTYPGMGDGSLAPQMSRQSLYWTDQWVGGTNSRPPTGWKRGFKSSRESPSPNAFGSFEMIYVRNDYEPNPSSGGAAGMSPLTFRYLFAGVWLVRSGDAVLFGDFLLQVQGSQISGALSGSHPELGIIRDCTISNNVLRFNIWRQSPYSVPGRYAPQVFAGTGEIVMDSDGKSFKGTILGAPANGTLIAR